MHRRFNIELEYSDRHISRSLLRNCLRQSLCDLPIWSPIISSQPDFKKWVIQNEHCGHEILSPMLEGSKENLDYICNVFNKTKHNLSSYSRAAVRATCGFHVNIEIFDFNQNQIINLINIFHNFESCFLKNLCPPSRTNNRYCEPIARHWNSSNNNFSLESLEREDSFLNIESYGFNLRNYSQKGTFESRYAASSLKGNKVRGWTRLMLILTEIAKISSSVEINHTESKEDLIDFINSFTFDNYLEEEKEKAINWINFREKAIARNKSKVSLSQEGI